jgi:hypothetical protein
MPLLLRLRLPLAAAIAAGAVVGSIALLTLLWGRW